MRPSPRASWGHGHPSEKKPWHREHRPTFPRRPLHRSPPPASVDPPVLDASIHAIITHGLRVQRFSQSLTTLLRFLHIVLWAGLMWGCYLEYSLGGGPRALSVIRVGSLRPPEGGVAPGAGWVGPLLQSWALGHCGLVAIQALACSGLVPASQPTHWHEQGFLGEEPRKGTEATTESAWMEGGGVGSWPLACDGWPRTWMLKEKNRILFSAACWDTREEGTWSSGAQGPSSVPQLVLLSGSETVWHFSCFGLDCAMCCK